MAFPTITNPTNTDSQDDILYPDSGDTGLRYLGHDRASYGFMLFTPKYANGLEYLFKLNPQSVEMDEEAAITITPTQGGGKFIENQGSIFKDIIINGTTGFLPLKNFKGVQGPSLLQQAAARIVSSDNTSAQQSFSKASGYHEFHKLRSIFREYLQIHRVDKVEVRKQTSLFWVNLKDNEVWLVEPLSFRTSRASRSPMTYNYSIRLRTISRATFGSVPPDLSTVTQATSFLGAVRQSLVVIRDRIDAVNALLQESLSFFNQYRNLRSLVVSILDTGTDLSANLTKIASGAADVIDLPRSVLYSATANIASVFEGIQNAADLVVSVPIDTLDGLTSMRQQIDFVLARNDLFEKKWTNAWGDAIANFNAAYGVEGDASSFLKDGTSRNALMEATPTSGESIYQFAQRVTGDATRAHEIIVLNNLRWPYFAPSQEERSPGTVAPGDPVLVPTDFATNTNNNLVTTSVGTKDRTYKDEVLTSSSTTLEKSGVDHLRPNEWIGYTVEILTSAAAGQSRLIVSNTESQLVVDKPWTTNPPTNALFRIYFKRVTQSVRTGMEELLGIDLRIAENPLTHTWDLVRDSTGDISTIRGQDNLNQALTVKFLTTQGELILHPWFGLKPTFGQRGTPEALFRLRLFFEQTLLSDSRIESVENLIVRQERDMYLTEAKLAVKGGLRSKFVSPLV